MSRRIFRSMSVFGMMTLLSRITGLWRDVVYASAFSILVTDAWFTAYQIPNFLRRLFAEGAFSQAFVPVVSEYRTRNTTEQTRDLVDSVAGTLGGFLLVVSLLGSLAAPVIIWVMARGFPVGSEKYVIAVEMLRWTFPYLFFVSMTALAGGVLNSYGRFGVPAFSSVLLNLVMIVAALWVAPHLEKPYLALGIGVFVAGIAQLLIHLPVLLQLKLLHKPRWNLKHEGVQRIGKLMVPAIVGSSMGQISVMISAAIATGLADGSVTWLYLADRLVEFPLGIFSIGLATVILPSLSAHHAAASPERFTATLDWSLRLICVVVIPAAVALFVLAGPLTVLMFYRGKFSVDSVTMTTYATMAYSFALLGWSLVKVLAPGFYARQDTKTPVRTAMWSFGLTMTLNLIVITVLFSTGQRLQPGMHIMLALATAAGATLNPWLLYRGLRKQGVYQPAPGWLALLARVVLASVLMAVFLRYFAADIQQWLQVGTGKRAIWMTKLVVGGAGLYFASLWLFGLRPAHLKH
ncbi:MAG: murein biosynthesis integral membrane protein MurJ [Steroidobacteraceae bacterium]